MEFTYKVTEAEYLRAWRLRIKGFSGSPLIKTVMFWVFVIVCLMMLWGIVQRNAQRAPSEPTVSQQATIDDEVDTPSRPADKMWRLATNVGPFILVAGVWVFVVLRLPPMRLRRLYRKDPTMQGVFTVSITPTSMSMQNTAGISSQTGWNIYEYWREGKDVVILVMQSSAYFIISLAALSDLQRNEFRSILTSALPKK